MRLGRGFFAASASIERRSANFVELIRISQWAGKKRDQFGRLSLAEMSITQWKISKLVSPNTTVTPIHKRARRLP